MTARNIDMMDRIQMGDIQIEHVNAEDPVTTGDFYDCDEDQESLTYRDPAEAIDNELNSSIQDGESMLDLIKRLAPLTVFVFKTDKVSQDFIVRLQDDVIDRLVETWNESEYCNPEDYDECKAAKEAAKEHIAKAAEAFASKANVWSCTKVGTLTYTEADLLDMYKDDL